MFYDAIGTTDFEWAGKPYAAIRDVAEADGSVLVVPVGSIEQHGHHLPVATERSSSTRWFTARLTTSRRTCRSW